VNKLASKAEEKQSVKTEFEKEDEWKERLEKKIDELLTKLMIDHRKDSFPAQLSGGEKSATVLTLILAIQAYNPALFYFLDEVDMHLDDVHSENLGKLLAEFSENAQYLVITPRNEYLRTYADRVYSLWKEKGVTNVVCKKIDDYSLLYEPA